MPKLQKIYQYEPGLGDIMSPKPGIVKPEIIRSLDIPFASRTSPGTDKTQRGMMIRCTEHGANLARFWRGLTFVSEQSSEINVNPAGWALLFDPPINFFVFWYTTASAIQRVKWRPVFGLPFIRDYVKDTRHNELCEITEMYFNATEEAEALPQATLVAFRY